MLKGLETMRSAIRTLLVAALALPAVQAVLVGVAGLLSGMGDERGAAIVRCIGTACLVVWTVILVTLLIAVAVVVANEEGPNLADKSQTQQDEDDME
jgi:hypothetical protein